MTLILIVLLILLLAGGGWGWHGGYVGYNPIGLVLFVILIVVLLGLFLPFAGYRWYP